MKKLTLAALAAAASLLAAGCATKADPAWPDCVKFHKGQLESLRAYRGEWSYARNASVWMNEGIFSAHEDEILPGARLPEMTEEAILQRLREANGDPGVITRTVRSGVSAVRDFVVDPITLPRNEPLFENSSFTAFVPVDAYPSRDGADWASLSRLKDAARAALEQAGYRLQKKAAVESGSDNRLVLDFAVENEEKGCRPHAASDIAWEDGCHLRLTVAYTDAGKSSRTAAVKTPSWIDPAEPLVWRSSGGSIEFQVPAKAYGWFYDRPRIVNGIARHAPANYLVYGKAYSAPELYGGHTLPFISVRGIKHFWYLQGGDK